MKLSFQKLIFGLYAFMVGSVVLLMVLSFFRGPNEFIFEAIRTGILTSLLIGQFYIIFRGSAKEVEK